MDKKKYYVVGYVTQVYILDETEAVSKNEVIDKLGLNSENNYVASDEEFDELIKDKKMIYRKCEIDVGVLDEEKMEYVFNVD